MPSATPEPSALLAAWRRREGRGATPLGSRPLSRADRVNLSSRELVAVQQLTAALHPASNQSDVAAAPTRLPSLTDSISPPSQLLRPPASRSPSPDRLTTPAAGAKKTEWRKHAVERSNTAAVLREHRRAVAAKRAEASDAAVAKLAYIAHSPQRLRAQRLREATATDHAAHRRAGFTLSVHVDRARDEAAAITPRHVKARYLGDLSAAERLGRVPSAWWAAEKQRLGLGIRDGSDQPPLDASSGDAAMLSEELQKRSAVKAARRGLPPPEGFTQLSEAISAVVVADKSGRQCAPPTPLCGDTMTYWDRVNFYNRFQESCVGGNEKDLRATIPRNRSRR